MLLILLILSSSKNIGVATPAPSEDRVGDDVGAKGSGTTSKGSHCERGSMRSGHLRGRLWLMEHEDELAAGATSDLIGPREWATKLGLILASGAPYI